MINGEWRFRSGYGCSILEVRRKCGFYLNHKEPNIVNRGSARRSGRGGLLKFLEHVKVNNLC